jgi:hypothetical protein
MVNYLPSRGECVAHRDHSPVLSSTIYRRRGMVYTSRLKHLCVLHWSTAGVLTIKFLKKCRLEFGRQLFEVPFTNKKIVYKLWKVTKKQFLLWTAKCHAEGALSQEQRTWRELMLTWRCLQENHWPDSQYKWICPCYEHDMKEILLNFHK